MNTNMYKRCKTRYKIRKDMMYGIVPFTKTLVRCVFCGVQVPRAARCIEQHSMGSRHRECIRYMSQHGMNYKNLAVYCKPCGRSLSHDDNVQSHIEGYEHDNWLTDIKQMTEGEFINIDRYLSLDSEDATCEICDCTVPCSFESIDAHVKSAGHKTSVYNFLKPRNGMITVNNGKKVWCKVCDIYFDNDVFVLMRHLDTDMAHMQWFMAVDDQLQGQDVSIHSFLTVEKETKAYCHRCNMHMICNARAIEAHVQSESHLYRVL